MESEALSDSGIVVDLTSVKDEPSDKEETTVTKTGVPSCDKLSTSDSDTVNQSCPAQCVDSTSQEMQVEDTNEVAADTGKSTEVQTLASTPSHFTSDDNTNSEVSVVVEIQPTEANAPNETKSGKLGQSSAELVVEDGKEENSVDSESVIIVEEGRETTSVDSESVVGMEEGRETTSVDSESVIIVEDGRETTKVDSESVVVVEVVREKTSADSESVIVVEEGTETTSVDSESVIMVEEGKDSTTVDNDDCMMMEYRTAGGVVVIDGSSDTSDDSSESEAENVDTNTKINKAFDRDYSPDRERKVKMNRYGFEDIRTKGEILPEELPPLEELTITVDETVEMVLVGHIKSIVGVLVVIQCEENIPPLNDDTILFVEGHTVLGQVFEVFGPVRAPWYSVRFNDLDNIASKGLKVEMPVYCAPKEEAFTKYVFVDSLKRMKGSDASWEDNNEPPEKHMEYSDDEAEKRAKAKRKNRKPKENSNAEEGQTQGEKKNKPNQNQSWPPREHHEPRPRHNQPQDRSRNPFQGNNASINRPRFAGRQQYNCPRNGPNQNWDANQSNFNRPPLSFGGPPSFQNTGRPMFQNQNQTPPNPGQHCGSMRPNQYSNNAANGNQNTMFGNGSQTQNNPQSGSPMFPPPMFGSPPPSMAVNRPQSSGPPSLLQGTAASNMHTSQQQFTPNQQNSSQFGTGLQGQHQNPYNGHPHQMAENQNRSFMMGNNTSNQSFQNANNSANGQGRPSQPKKFQVHGLNPALSNSGTSQFGERSSGKYDQVPLHGSTVAPYRQNEQSSNMSTYRQNEQGSNVSTYRPNEQGANMSTFRQNVQGSNMSTYRQNEQPNTTVNCERTSYNSPGLQNNHGQSANYMSQQNINARNSGQNWPMNGPNMQNNGPFQNSNNSNADRQNHMGGMFSTGDVGTHNTGGFTQGNTAFTRNSVLDQRFIQNNSNV